MNSFADRYDDLVWKWRMGVITDDQFHDQWVVLIREEEAAQ